MPDIITRALLESKGIPTRDIVAAIWGRKLSGGYEPAEATGTLPLTFRSNGTALLDYRIYGNTVETTVKTANIVPLATQKTATADGITVTIDDSGVWHVTGTASQDVNILFDLEEAFTVPTALDNGGEGVIQFFNSVAMDDGSGYETARVLFYYGNVQRDYMGLHIQNRSITQYSDLANMAINRLGIWVKQGITCDFTLSPMVVDDGIVHNEYIPPEITEVQGVGVRTENLFDPNAAETSGNNIISDFMPLDPSELVLTMAFDIPLRASYNYNVTYYDSTKTAISFVGGMGEAYKTRETVKLNRQSEAPNAVYVKVTLPKDLTNVLIQNGSTSGEHIPYGYKLPMVSRSGTRRTETPIYIGDTQLMQDEYVSYGEQAIYKSISLYGISEYIDTLNLSTGILTRKVKKMVLNGTEDFVSNKYTYTASFVLDIPDISLLTFRVFSNYFQGGDSLPAQAYRKDKIFVTLAPVFERQAIAIGSVTWKGDVAAFKNFLAEKYASGNPVTVWYVLESPEITNLPVSSKASGTLEGYLAQSETPSPSNPIYPTYARAHYPTDPPVPLPQLPTFSDTNTVLDYEETPAPEEVWVKYKKGD